MMAGAITPALPPRIARAQAARASEAEKAAPVLELRLEIRSKPGDQAEAQTKDGASQNETDPRDALLLQNTATFVAQVIGQFLDATTGAKPALAYARVRNPRTSYLYDWRS
jgi:hypothetical protein